MTVSVDEPPAPPTDELNHASDAPAAPDASTTFVAPPNATPPAESPYPTTGFSPLNLPGGDPATMPRVRTTEPAAAIARLRGDIQQVSPR